MALHGPKVFACVATAAVSLGGVFALASLDNHVHDGNDFVITERTVPEDNLFRHGVSDRIPYSSPDDRYLIFTDKNTGESLLFDARKTTVASIPEKSLD